MTYYIVYVCKLLIMRKLVTTAALLSALSAGAQEFSADSITSFSGIMPGRDNHVFYFYYTKPVPGAKDKTDLYLKSFSRDINPNEKTKISLAKGDEVLACNNNGNIFFVLIGNRSAKTITRSLWEPNGKAKKTITEQVPSSFFDNKNDIKVVTAMPDVFILITPVESKKHKGYKAQQFDQEMNERWNKTYIPENGDYQVISAESSMERVLVTRKQTQGGNVTYSMQSIMSDNGEQLNNYEIKNNDAPATPAAIVKADDITAVTGPIGTAEKPQGIYLQILGPGGEVRNNVQITNEKFIDSLKGYTRSDIVSGSMNLYPEDVKRTARGLQLVTEMYSLKKAGKDYTLKTGNFVLFELDHEGNITGIKTIETSGKNVTLSGDLGDMQPGDLLQWAFKRRLFAYRPTPAIRKAVMAYKSYENDQATAHLVNLTDVTPAGKPIEQSFTLKHLDKPKADPINIGSTQVDATNYNDIISGAENNCILYQYNGSRLDIWMQPMPF